MDDVLATRPDPGLVQTSVAYGAPAMLVLADDATGASAVEAAGRALGFSIAGVCGIDDGIARIAAGAEADVIVLALDEDCKASERGIDLLAARAARAMVRSAVIVPHRLLDLAAARADHDDIVLLCDPGPTELVTALALLVAPPAARVQDSGGMIDGRDGAKAQDIAGKLFGIGGIGHGRTMARPIRCCAALHLERQPLQMQGVAPIRRRASLAVGC